MDFASFFYGALASILLTVIVTIAYDYLRTTYIVLTRSEYSALMLDARNNLTKLRMLEEEVRDLQWEYDVLQEQSLQ